MEKQPVAACELDKDCPPFYLLCLAINMRPCSYVVDYVKLCIKYYGYINNLLKTVIVLIIPEKRGCQLFSEIVDLVIVDFRLLLAGCKWSITQSKITQSTICQSSLLISISLNY